MSKKQAVLYTLLSISLTCNLWLFGLLKLGWERSAVQEYWFDVMVGKDKVKPGMTVNEVIAVMHQPPGRIELKNHGTQYTWSPRYQKMPLNHLIWPPMTEGGSFWVDIFFDSDGRVERVEVSEA